MPLFDRAAAGEFEAHISQHGLLEVYATISRMPVRPPPSPAEVLDTIESVIKTLRVVTLTDEDYFEVLRRARDLGARGGTVYDLLHIRSAQKSGADALATFNQKHFERLSEGTGLHIFEP